MTSEANSSAERLVQLAFVVSALVVWWAVGETGAVSPLFLPPIGAVGTSLVHLAGTALFWSAAATTLRTILAAYVISAVIGLGVGYAITRSRFATAVLEPIVSAIFSIPITLFFPLFILFFGIGPDSKIAYGACYGAFPIALATIAAFSSVDERLVRAARAAGFTRFGLFRHLLLPAAFPVMITGLRVGFFICFASVLGGETISSISGVGHNIALEAELMEPARMYAWIVFVILVSLVLNAIASLFENRRRDS